MATPNERGGWDLTDEDVAEVAHASFGALEDVGEAAFFFMARGKPRYGDVPTYSGWVGTYEQAERNGIRMLTVGNWLSFTIEKRYFPASVLDGD